MESRKVKVSTRAKKYIKNKVAGMSDYQAAVAAGYSPNTAIAAAQNIENPSVKMEIKELMEKKGLTDDHLLDVLSEGLNTASRIQGTDNDFVEVPDYQTRHKYLETALKLKGKLGKENQPSVQVNVQANIEAQKAKYDI